VKSKSRRRDIIEVKRKNMNSKNYDGKDVVGKGKIIREKSRS